MTSVDVRVAAARAYVDALVSHDPSQVPFAPDCTRTEMGVRTGFSGSHLARSLANGPQFRVIHTIFDFVSRVDDAGVVHTDYWLGVGPKALRLRVNVKETFEFDDEDRIIKLVAKFGVPRRG